MIENKFPWFACYQAKLLEALGGMKSDVKLVYLIMILRIYDCEGPCPDTLEAIALRCGLNRRRTSDALDILFRAGKLTRESDGIMNPIAREIIAESDAFRAGRQRAGQKGANRRWQKDEQKQHQPNGTAIGLPMANDGYLHLQDSLLPLESVPLGESVPSSSVVGASRKNPRGARQAMREDWEPTDIGFQYARDLGFSPEKITTLVRACRDYYIRRGFLIAGDRGLAATWRNWCNCEVKFEKEKSNGYRGQRTLQDDSKSVSGAATRLQIAIENTRVQFAPRPKLDSQPGENDMRLLPPRRST